MPFLNGATVGFDTVNNKAVFIDQTLLPNEYKEIFTDDYGEIFDAIKLLKVRGAPAIGVFTAISLAVLMNKSNAVTYEGLFAEFKKYSENLILCRPTAVNLKWAAEEMLKTAENCTAEDFKEALTNKALKMIDDDIAICRKIGEYGAEILKEYAKKDKNAPEHIAFRSADDSHTFSYTLISVACGTRGGVYPRARPYSRGTCRRRGAVAPAA